VVKARTKPAIPRPYAANPRTVAKETKEICRVGTQLGCRVVCVHLKIRKAGVKRTMDIGSNNLCEKEVLYATSAISDEAGELPVFEGELPCVEVVGEGLGSLGESMEAHSVKNVRWTPDPSALIPLWSWPPLNVEFEGVRTPV
jgi:hypothetical protein